MLLSRVSSIAHMETGNWKQDLKNQEPQSPKLYKQTDKSGLTLQIKMNYLLQQTNEQHVPENFGLSSCTGSCSCGGGDGGSGGGGDGGGVGGGGYSA